jgi:hypothetical protein
MHLTGVEYTGVTILLLLILKNLWKIDNETDLIVFEYKYSNLNYLNSNTLQDWL